MAQYFLSQGFSLHQRNKRVAGVEIDLIFSKPKWCFVEVKSLRHWDDLPFRVTHSQRERLMVARQFWQDQVDEEVLLKFAFALKDQIKVLDLEDIL